MSSRIAAWPPVRSIATATGVTKKSSPTPAAAAAGIDTSRLIAEGDVGSTRRIALASARARRTLGRASAAEEEVILETTKAEVKEWKRERERKKKLCFFSSSTAFFF